MLAALVLLIFAYYIVSANFADSDLTDGTDDTEDTSVKVNSIDQSSIVGVSYTYEGVEYEFALSGEKWKFLADESFPVDAAEISDITSALSGIVADRAIEGDLHSADYGLDKPTHTVKVTLSAGGVLTYNIGAYNKHTDSYYMTAEGHNRIYMVTSDFGELFARDLYELVETETTPSIALTDVKKLTAELSDGIVITLELTETEDGESEWKHTNRLGAEAVMETATAEKAISALISPSTGKCVHHDLPDGKLADYGMDTGSRIRLTVYYTTSVSANQSDSSSSTAGGSVSVSREFVYYIGNVITETADTAGDTAADTTADTTAETTADTSEETTADTAADTDTSDETAEPEQEKHTYFMLDGSKMVYEVDLSAADVLFE